MSITTETNRTAELTTDGAETDFDFSLLIHDESELQVLYKVTDGSYSQLTLNTDYGVVFTEYGGTVSTNGYIAPLAAGTLLIIRHIALTQQTNWLYNDNHSGTQHQDDFDRSVMRDLQMQEELDRCPKFLLSSSTTGIGFPEPDANQIIGWNAAGTNLTNISPAALAVLIAEDIIAGEVPTELTDLTDVTIDVPVAGNVLRYDGGQWTNYPDNNYLPAQTIGIADNNLLEVDGTPNSGEYARFTANGLEGRTEGEFKGDYSVQTQGDVLDDLNALGAVAADSEFLVGRGAGVFAWEKDNVARTSLGLGTGDSPTFDDITMQGHLFTLGDATDTEIQLSFLSDVVGKKFTWNKTDGFEFDDELTLVGAGADLEVGGSATVTGNLLAANLTSTTGILTLIGAGAQVNYENFLAIQGTAATQIITFDSTAHANLWATTLTSTTTALSTAGILALSATGGIQLNSDVGVAGDSDLLQLAVDTLRVNGAVGIRIAPTYPLHVPWISGDAVSTAFFGSSNVNNNQIAIQGRSYSNRGVEGISTTQPGVYGASILGIGISGVGGGGANALGGQFDYYSATDNNTLKEVVRIRRYTTHASDGANGIGGSINFQIENDNNQLELSGRFGCLLTDVTDGAEKSSFVCYTRNQAGDGLIERMRLDHVGNLVLNKTSGIGIKVDTATPTFGWRDLLGEISIKTIGANDPDYNDYAATGIHRYQFKNTTMTEVYDDYHIPHDYVPGSDVHVHIHWSQTTIDTGGAASAPGVAKWYFDANYSKGHDRGAFPANIVTVSVTQTASGTIRQHMIAEVQLSTSGQIGGQDIEPDGVITVRAYRDAADAADTLDQRPWVHHVDVHYQSTNIATKAKVPDFYT